MVDARPRSRKGSVLAQAPTRGASASRTRSLPAESFGAIDDARSQEDHQLAAAIARAAALKEQPDQRDVTEERHLIQVATGVASEDAADDRGVAVEHEQIGLGLALEDGWIAARGGWLEASFLR